MRDRLVARSEIPISSGRENEVAGSWRIRDRRDLDDAVGIVALDRCLIRGAWVESPQIPTEAEGIPALASIAEARAIRADHRRAALARANFAPLRVVR